MTFGIFSYSTRNLASKINTKAGLCIMYGRLHQFDILYIWGCMTMDPSIFTRLRPERCLLIITYYSLAAKTPLLYITILYITINIIIATHFIYNNASNTTHASLYYRLPSMFSLKVFLKATHYWFPTHEYFSLLYLNRTIYDSKQFTAICRLNFSSPFVFCITYNITKGRGLPIQALYSHCPWW